MFIKTFKVIQLKLETSMIQTSKRGNTKNITSAQEVNLNEH